MKRFIALGIATFSLAGPAMAIDYPEERGLVPSVVPPAPDETGRVNNVPQWRTVTPVAPAPRAANSIDDYFARYDANQDRKSTRLNSSHSSISYAVFCLKKKKQHTNIAINS